MLLINLTYVERQTEGKKVTEEVHFFSLKNICKMCNIICKANI